MFEIQGDLRFTAETILRPRIRDGAGADDFDRDLPPGFIRRHKDCAGSSMMKHAFQLIPHIDHIRYRLDASQLDEAIATELHIRWITTITRNAFTYSVGRIVSRHTISSPT